MTSTKDVLDNHLNAFGKGDLASILSGYAPEAVMFTRDGLLKGAEAMRPLFEALIEEFRKPGARFTLERQSIEGDYAYIVWTAETADNVYEVATDTFVVQDGKIAAQSFTGKTVPKGCRMPGTWPPRPCRGAWGSSRGCSTRPSPPSGTGWRSLRSSTPSGSASTRPGSRSTISMKTRAASRPPSSSWPRSPRRRRGSASEPAS